MHCGISEYAKSTSHSDWKLDKNKYSFKGRLLSKPVLRDTGGRAGCERYHSWATRHAR